VRLAGLVSGRQNELRRDELLRQQRPEFVLVLRVGQPLEEETQVGIGLKPVGFRSFDEGVDGRTGFSATGAARKEPVLPAHGEGSNGVFDEIVVDPQPTILKVDDKTAPLISGVSDGLAEQAFGRRVHGPDIEQLFDLIEDWLGLGLAQGFDLFWLQFQLCSPLLNGVELTNFLQDDVGHPSAVLGFVSTRRLDYVYKFAAHVGHAALHSDAGILHERVIADIAVCLDPSLEVTDEVFGNAAGSRWRIVEIYARLVSRSSPSHPHKGGGRVGAARLPEDLDRGFVQTQHRSRADVFQQQLHERLNRPPDQQRPVAHGGTGEFDTQTSELGLLAVERLCVRELGDQYVSQQPRRDDPLRDDLGRYRGQLYRAALGLNAFAGAAGVLDANVPDDLDFRGDYVELLADLFAHAGQSVTAGADLLHLGQVVGDIDPRQVCWQRPPTAFLARMCRDLNDALNFGRYLNSSLGLVEKRVLLLRRGVRLLAFLGFGTEKHGLEQPDSLFEIGDNLEIFGDDPLEGYGVVSEGENVHGCQQSTLNTPDLRGKSCSHDVRISCPSVSLDLAQVEPFEYPRKLTATDCHDFGLGLRPAETVTLQAFLPKAETVAVPVQHLDDSPAAVAENEVRARERISSQLVSNNDREPVNRLAHVSGSEHEKDLSRARNRIHTSRSSVETSFSRTDAEKSPPIAMWKRSATVRHSVDGRRDAGEGSGALGTCNGNGTIVTGGGSWRTGAGMEANLRCQ